ncbi:PHP domain-containing protein [Paenibacillus sp. N1-5-1-14]|uniref:PHP domain-containing protein n=1 Tax=Paenibacillus radicibacter TaxID=2972488 RepID=UPI002159568C|nr:PHP domain-containing protein [Paenibacillus radicibacter]MCR8641160.1 PHP domain-containing protein [Paenibacillus radicibacter]
MIDLHCHTKISDNNLSMLEVITLAKHNGVEHLSITDHDTTIGLLEAMKIGEQVGVNIIPGIEISAYDYKNGRRAHILGFHVTPGHPAISELCQPMIVKRHEASEQMTNMIINEGYNITWERVLEISHGGTGVYKQHIMHALIEQNYTESIYGDLYKTLFSRGERGAAKGIAHIPLEYVDVYDAIEAILEAGGVPVIAHAAQFNNWDAIPSMVAGGLQGIEVRHPDHNDQVEAKAREIAETYKLAFTGGSDFHGMYGERGACELGSKNPGVASLESLQAKRG